MTILGIVSYKVFPARLGGQKGIADFYRALSRKCKIVLAVSDDNDLTHPEPFSVYPFLFNQWRGFLNLFYIFMLARIIKKEKAQIIVLEHSYFGWLGILLRALTGKPYAIHSHNIESHRFNVAGRKWWRLYVRYEIFVHQQADFTFFKCVEDRDWALAQWHLNEAKTLIVTYGTDIHSAPTALEKADCRSRIRQMHGFAADETIFLFNGSLNYAPNIDSIHIILQELVPALNETSFKYRIIICGDFISEELKQAVQAVPQLLFTGYVADINLYFRAADAFISPTILATGIKTKLVEALANNVTVISTRNGARGISKSLTGEKMVLVENANWKEFARVMTETPYLIKTDTPSSFFEAFYWGNIVERVDNILHTMQ